MPLIMPEQVSGTSVATNQVSTESVSSGVRTGYAELIPIRIEERHPAETVHVLAVVLGCSGLDEPRHLGVEIRTPQIEMDAILAGGGVRDLLECEVGGAVRDRDDVEPTVVFLDDVSAQLRCPPRCERTGIETVEGDHAECESHAHTLMEATDKDSRSRAEMRRSSNATHNAARPCCRTTLRSFHRDRLAPEHPRSARLAICHTIHANRTCRNPTPTTAADGGRQ